MSQGPLCPNLTKKVQKEVSQKANHNLPCAMLLGGLSVNLNHIKRLSKLIAADMVTCVTNFFHQQTILNIKM